MPSLKVQMKIIIIKLPPSGPAIRDHVKGKREEGPGVSNTALHFAYKFGGRSRPRLFSEGE